MTTPPTRTSADALATGTNANHKHLPPVAVAVLARVAALGVGKRRLAETLGDGAALEIYRELITTCAQAVIESGLPATVFFDPVPGDETVWPPQHFDYSLQPNVPDLGTRIQAAAEESLLRYGGGVLLIGTDCPDLTPELLRRAAAVLRTHDAVLGPSTDGGYYLLGLRAVEPRLFGEIAWSTAAVADQTRTVLAKAGLSTYELPPLRDIDTEADWRAYRAAHKSRTRDLG